MKYILFYFFFLNPLYSQEKVNKATYSFQMILENVSDLKKIPGEKLNRFAEYAELIVYFDSNYSYYLISENLNTNNLDEDFFLTTSIMLNAYYPIFFNKKSNFFLYEDALARDKIILDNNVFNWTFVNESKKIDNYICYKAIGKAKDLWDDENNSEQLVEVWYCPELPYPFGPNMYQGLPGLVVLAIQNNEITYKLEKIEFNVPEKLPLNILEAETINVTEFHKFRKELFGE